MFITTYDYLLSLLYLAIIYGFLSSYARRKYRSEIIRKHFLWGFTVKAVGALAVGMIYQYYYGFGDTFGYFKMGRFFSEVVRNEPGEAFKILWAGDRQYLQTKAYEYGFRSWYAFNPGTVVTARICALFSFLSFGYYLPTALLFALFSFSGLWKLYRVFTDQYSNLRKELAWFILFLPSVFFWGSGILKDSITIGALGWLTWAFYSFFVKRSNILTSIVIAVVCFNLIFQIKAYIAMAYLPAIAAWILFDRIKSTRNAATKQALKGLFVAAAAVGLILIGNALKQELEATIEDVTQQAIATQQNIQDLTAGSSYSLGNVQPGTTGLLQIMLPALVVTLFRPFVWETNNIFSLFSALESTFFIWFTLFVIFKAGIRGFFATVFSQPIALYCLTFAVMFAIPVGIASGNFGSLVRYKIPCLPFYLIGLLIVYYRSTGKTLFHKKSIPIRRSKPAHTSQVSH